MKWFPFLSLFAGIFCWTLAVFILTRGLQAAVQRSFALVTALIGIWSFFPFVSSLAIAKDPMIFWLRLIYFPALYVPAAFIFFMANLLGLIERPMTRRVFWAALAVSTGLGMQAMTSGFIADLRPNHYGYSLVPGPWYLFFIMYFAFSYMYASKKLLQQYWVATGQQRNQLRYIGIAFALAFISGLIHFSTAFGFREVVSHDILVVAYSLLIAYAVIRHRLLDVRLAMSRAALLLVVYAIVLGGPYWLAAVWRTTLQAHFGEAWVFVPITLAVVFATAGPFVYYFIQRRTEDRLLAEQRRYQKTLIQASSGMGHIKDLEKLIKLIARIVMRAVKPEHCVVYVLDKSSGKYILGSALSRDKGVSFPPAIPEKTSFIQYIREQGVPVLPDELRHQASRASKIGLSAIALELSWLKAAMLVPSVIDGRMAAFLVLGVKPQGAPYSADDISVFTILANQSALAIENAQFYEDVKRTQQQLFDAEKMATIGTMADGLSHQINNRLHAMGFIAGDMRDTLKLSQDHFQASEKLQEISKEFDFGLSRLEENVVRGREIVQGLMKYTRKGEEGFTANDIDQIFNSAWEMAQFKIKQGVMKIAKEYDTATIPKVKGNFTQLQEVFFNMIDNGYDAMMQRKAELQEEGYQPLLRVQVEQRDGCLNIIFIDNGIGVKEADAKKLFTPFFTTKATSKKGTGLGLYVIKKIVEENHEGKIRFESVYKQGTTITVSLTAATPSF
ncbi:MAG: GAF domain-containing protein [Candidatus Omnitrophica bacterium]|nr:GAF domain-containing protein [Candidatus Omnitrophota bacterium]